MLLYLCTSDLRDQTKKQRIRCDVKRHTLYEKTPELEYGNIREQQGAKLAYMLVCVCMSVGACIVCLAISVSVCMRLYVCACARVMRVCARACDIFVLTEAHVGAALVHQTRKCAVLHRELAEHMTGRQRHLL